MTGLAESHVVFSRCLACCVGVSCYLVGIRHSLYAQKPFVAYDLLDRSRSGTLRQFLRYLKTQVCVFPPKWVILLCAREKGRLSSRAEVTYCHLLLTRYFKVDNSVLDLWCAIELARRLI